MAERDEYGDRLRASKELDKVVGQALENARLEGKLLGVTPEELEERLLWLDTLRESGATNMFGAAPYVQEEFLLSKSEARATLGLWMKTFSARHPKAQVLPDGGLPDGRSREGGA